MITKREKVFEKYKIMFDEFSLLCDGIYGVGLKSRNLFKDDNKKELERLRENTIKKFKQVEDYWINKCMKLDEKLRNEFRYTLKKYEKDNEDLRNEIKQLEDNNTLQDIWFLKKEITRLSKELAKYKKI